MNNKVFMTKEGRTKIEEDLRRMRGEETKELLDALSDAREKGDLSENSEYEVALEACEMLKNKIQQLEEKLLNSVIVDPSNVDLSAVQLFTTVKIKEKKSKKEKTFTIVPSDEIDAKSGKISLESPMGKALIGKSTGDLVKVVLPGGVVFECEIIGITI